MHRPIAPHFARLVLILGLAAPSASAELRFASVFSDNMVLQRDQPLRIWGEADPGVSVEVTIGTGGKTATADANGRWSLTFPPRNATTDPQTLRAAASGQETTLHNILVGDVWLCAGQSNMQMTLAETETGPAEVKAATKQT